MACWGSERCGRRQSDSTASPALKVNRAPLPTPPQTDTEFLIDLQGTRNHAVASWVPPDMFGDPARAAATLRHPSVPELLGLGHGTIVQRYESAKVPQRPDRPQATGLCIGLRAGSVTPIAAGSCQWHGGFLDR